MTSLLRILAENPVKCSSSPQKLGGDGRRGHAGLNGLAWACTDLLAGRTVARGRRVLVGEGQWRPGPAQARQTN